MLESIATLLFVLAGCCVMISGALPEPADARLRRLAGRLALIGVAVILLPVVVSAIPARYVILALVAASVAAFLLLEHRARDPRRVRPFVNYRTTGKRLMDDDDELPIHAREEEDERGYL